MRTPSWIRRRGGATLTAPAGNGAPPAEAAARLRPRDPDAVAAPALPRARRLLQPLPLLGLLLVLVALVGYWSVYRASTKRTPVLVAARGLSAGSVLRAGDVRTGELAADGRTMGALVPLGARAAAPSAFTLVVPALHALAGSLQPGDRVTVLATYGSGSGQARTRPIARGLEVLAVGTPPSGIDSSAASIPVTLALPDPALASALALANSDAKLDLLRESGRARTAPIPPASEGGGR
jgi:Flp pilus assembly protein CpaB